MKRSSSWEMYQTLRDEEKRRKREINNNFRDNYYGLKYFQPYDKYGEGHRHNNRAW